MAGLTGGRLPLKNATFTIQDRDSGNILMSGDIDSLDFTWEEGIGRNISAGADEEITIRLHRFLFPVSSLAWHLDVSNNVLRRYGCAARRMLALRGKRKKVKRCPR